jgi:xylose isomerase
MPDTIFSGLSTVKYEGPTTENPLAYRWYDPDKVVLGKPLCDHLRFAVAYWHSLALTGSDPFGGPTIRRPWMGCGDPIAEAKVKADAAFELVRALDFPFFCLHDADIAPPGDTLTETLRNFHTIVDYIGEKMQSYPTRLLSGTANLFSHPRFMAGASTNPDPDVFAWCAATVKNCMDATKQLGGSNYVLWGGREGYETLLNTNMKQELQQRGRFLALVVEYKHKIGYDGQILIEPKPKEPTSHQYDFDCATVYGFLKRFGLENEVRVNLEANHATLAGHTFEHEIAAAGSLGSSAQVADLPGAAKAERGAAGFSAEGCGNRRIGCRFRRSSGCFPASGHTTPPARPGVCGAGRGSPERSSRTAGCGFSRSLGISLCRSRRCVSGSGKHVLLSL